MPFLNVTLDIEIYTDSAQTEFPQELVPHIVKEFEDTAVTQIQATTVSIAANGSQTINLNGLTSVKRFYLFSDTTALNVNMNGLGNITYQAQEAGYCPLNITSLVLGNASSTTATTATVILIGD